MLMSIALNQRPRWRDLGGFKPAQRSHLGAHKLKPPLRAWLDLPGSLSAHLRRCVGPLQVQRVSQGRGRLRRDEVACLGLAQGIQRGFFRQVILRCQAQPVVMAQTVGPMRAPLGAWRGLRGLGSRPLAELLFADRRVQRQPLQVARVSTRSALGRQWARLWQQHTQSLTWQPSTCADLWARRSVFWRLGMPLLVTEVFDASLSAHPPGCTARKPRSPRGKTWSKTRGKPQHFASARITLGR
jgi:chorismate--pyruvate lyase